MHGSSISVLSDLKGTANLLWDNIYVMRTTCKQINSAPFIILDDMKNLVTAYLNEVYSGPQDAAVFKRWGWAVEVEFEGERERRQARTSFERSAAKPR